MTGSAPGEEKSPPAPGVSALESPMRGLRSLVSVMTWVGRGTGVCARPSRLFLLGAVLLAAGAAAAGDVGRGAALFEERCVMCHVAQALQGKGGRLVNDLRQIDGAMFPVGILADQEVADLAAFLNALASEKRL
jgi:mono/diheme cytochrome c family protein